METRIHPREDNLIDKRDASSMMQELVRKERKATEDYWRSVHLEIDWNYQRELRRQRGIILALGGGWSATIILWMASLF